MKTFDVTFDGLCNIGIDKETFNEGGIIVKFTGNFPTDMDAHIRIYPKKTYTEDDYEMVEEVEYVVPDHPNCRYGECGTCQVVSCGIYQGYMPEPSRSECLRQTHLVRRLKPGRE